MRRTVAADQRLADCPQVPTAMQLTGIIKFPTIAGVAKS
ncbi:protein of unknown function [Cupriavidus taiwanensis]|uniref:Uncharacterized protein n=1 Tax=Cupriavidus taiwanensis TaxID=164546 RepID=A0A7Z7JBD8_9BURK|nr:protein of unknown function [Cupriavidus taiwanensis]SOZ08170.1 hypothetical protein CBM2597_A90776 [Cupriavidus taiwanensis]SPC18717.1 hypothetical protein CBM2594_A80156 [Cupriavidus taiwanensis]SPD41032.1 protein of unknown function [Cupriavidus taiwanensis]